MSDDRRDDDRPNTSAGEPPIQPGTGATAASEEGRVIAGENPDGTAPPPAKGAMTGTMGCILLLVLIGILFAIFYGYRA